MIGFQQLQKKSDFSNPPVLKYTKKHQPTTFIKQIDFIFFTESITKKKNILLCSIYVYKKKLNISFKLPHFKGFN